MNLCLGTRVYTTHGSSLRESLGKGINELGQLSYFTNVNCMLTNLRQVGLLLFGFTSTKVIIMILGI